MVETTPTTGELGRPRRALVVYHYFAHYREAVLTELIERGRHCYDFAGDTVDDGKGIRLTEAIPPDRFVRARCFNIGPIMLQPRLLALALSPRYDTLILLGNAFWPMTWAAALLGRAAGKRVLFWTHGWLTRERGARRVFRNAFYRIAHGLLVYGHNAKCIGIGEGFDPARIHVIYNSLDYRAQEHIRAALDPGEVERLRRAVYPDDDSAKVMTITRLQPAKKLDLLIEAAARCAAMGRPVSLLLVGDGPERARLEALARERGVRAHFYGACYEEPTIAALFGASDLCVIPGPAGLTVMHSLAYGTPFITNDDASTQMPEFEAVVDGVNGALYHAGDVDDLARRILGCTRTPELRERGRAKSIEIIERFFNPVTQGVLIDRAVSGLPADDLLPARVAPLYRARAGTGGPKPPAEGSP